MVTLSIIGASQRQTCAAWVRSARWFSSTADAWDSAIPTRVILIRRRTSIKFPVPLIERVEVLTGGASAIYGSDAVAGVVNFILKDHVQGVQIDGQVGFAQHTQHDDYIQGVESATGIAPPVGTTADGFRRTVSLLAGTALHNGEGQVTGYFIYAAQNPLFGSARDFSDCVAASANGWTGVPTQGGVLCVGSDASNMFVTNAGNGAAYSVVGNQFVPYPAAGSVPPPVSTMHLMSPYSGRIPGTRQASSPMSTSTRLRHPTLSSAS